MSKIITDLSLKSVANPTQSTATTFERDQAFANKVEQLSRVTKGMDPTPFTVKQGFLYGIAEGGWRHAMDLAPEGQVRDAPWADKTHLDIVTKGGRRIRVTFEYMDI